MGDPLLYLSSKADVRAVYSCHVFVAFLPGAVARNETHAHAVRQPVRLVHEVVSQSLLFVHVLRGTSGPCRERLCGSDELRVLVAGDCP